MGKYIPDYHRPISHQCFLYYQGLKQVYSMATESCQKSTMTSFAKIVNPLSANITKWSNVLKQFVGKLPTNCLSVFDHFVGSTLKGSRVKHRQLFSQNAPSYLFDRILNTPL